MEIVLMALKLLHVDGWITDQQTNMICILLLLVANMDQNKRKVDGSVKHLQRIEQI
jgi:hypothetical protein